MNKMTIQTARNSTPTVSSLQVDVIEAIADWCNALQGGMSLDDAFACLAAGLGADAAMLVRTHVSDGRPNRIAVWDARGTVGACPLTRAFGDGQFGADLMRAKPASVWLASQHQNDDVDPALGLWQERRKMGEFAVLVLTSGPVTRDHIELHFKGDLPAEIEATLATVMPTMARTWATRQIGLVTRTVINHRVVARPAAPAAGQSLLGVTNPARLSRAEFRVCLLLSRGLSAAGVAAELAISEATVRSHLRSIYAKTETSGLAELVFRLLDGIKAPVHADLRYA